jgi:hypothetical protein
MADLRAAHDRYHLIKFFERRLDAFAFLYQLGNFLEARAQILNVIIDFVELLIERRRAGFAGGCFVNDQERKPAPRRSAGLVRRSRVWRPTPGLWILRAALSLEGSLDRLTERPGRAELAGR